MTWIGDNMSEPPTTSYTPSRSHQSQLFSVRLWLEDLGEGRSEWRGQVQDVRTGERRYFRDWARLVACLQEMLDTRSAGTQ